MGSISPLRNMRTAPAPVALALRFQGSGCRVQGSGCRVQGSGFRVQGSGFRVNRKAPAVDAAVSLSKCVYRGTSLIRNTRDCPRACSVGVSVSGFRENLSLRPESECNVKLYQSMPYELNRPEGPRACRVGVSVSGFRV